MRYLGKISGPSIRVSLKSPKFEFCSVLLTTGVYTVQCTGMHGDSPLESPQHYRPKMFSIYNEGKFRKYIWQMAKYLAIWIGALKIASGLILKYNPEKGIKNISQKP